MKINQLDLFSGIGGFHLGFERAGYKVTSFFSEIDKHAIAVYKHQFPKSTYVGSVTNVRGSDLPRIDLITFGSPCQDFSLAGKRKGMEGDRSSLVLEAIRLIGECRPRVFIWENVKGTFSSNNGEDFSAILQEFTNIGGYRLEWQLLNTSWFLPQNRERIYLVGYSTTTKRNWRGVFPIGENGRTTSSAEVKQIGTKLDSNGGTQPYQQDRVYDAEGIVPALNRGKSDLIIKESVIGAIRGRNPQNPNDNSKGIEYKQRLELNKNRESNCLTSDVTMNMVIEPNYNNKAVIEQPMVGDYRMDEGWRIRQNGVTPTITQHCSRDGISNGVKVIEPTHRIRRLTPIECERLQGFPDNHTSMGNYDGEVKTMSNTQRYKQCGNAVTVDVVQAVAERCKPLFK